MKLEIDSAQLNVWFKCIRAGLALSPAEVASICAKGGRVVTASRASAWARREGKRRYTQMSLADFTAFTAGLPRFWAEDAIDQSGD